MSPFSGLAKSITGFTLIKKVNMRARHLYEQILSFANEAEIEGP